MAVKSSENTNAVIRFRAALSKWIQGIGKNRTQAADFLGMTQGNLTNILNGKRSISLAGMEDIANKINVDLAEMLIEGRAIMGGDAAPQTAANPDEAEFSPEQQKALKSFGVLLKCGDETHEPLIRIVIETAEKIEAKTGFLNDTGKRRSA